MPEVVHIARCAEHGLHGCRTECFVCGADVEQVPMVPLAEYERVKAENDRFWAAVKKEMDRPGRDWANEPSRNQPSGSAW